MWTAGQCLYALHRGADENEQETLKARAGALLMAEDMQLRRRQATNGE